MMLWLCKSPDKLKIMSPEESELAEARTDCTIRSNNGHTDSANVARRAGDHVTQWKRLLHGFCQHTTAHGWGRVGQTRLAVVRILWAAITLCALALNATHITLLVTHFLGFQSEVRLKVELSQIKFPSVTICNTQPMSQSSRQMMTSDPATRIHQWEDVLDNLHQFDGLAALLNQTEQFEKLKQQLHEPRAYFQNIGEEYESVGHQLRDLVLGCTFSDQPCAPSHFAAFTHQDYFNCYTFNGGKASGQTIVTQSMGPSAGLSLILYLETDSGHNIHNGSYHRYLNVGASAGVRVVIHPQNTRPYPLEQGLDIPPGFSASINLRYKTYTLLGEPYGECLGEHTASDQYTYTMTDCLLVCQQLYVIDTCGCISSLLPLSDSASSLPYCGRWHVRQLQHLADFLHRVTCEREAMVNFTSYKQRCGCVAACESQEYTSRLSYSHWPIHTSQQDFYQQYVLDNPAHPSLKAYTNLWPLNMSGILQNDLITKNFARVNIYIQDPTVEVHSQMASYELPNLASDIGGTFGLWIGMSLITWCEVLELLVAMAYSWLKKWLPTKSAQSTSSDYKAPAATNDT